MLVASRHFLLPSAALLYGICSVHGSVVTLYYVNQPAELAVPPAASFSLETEGTIIASALGPGDAGMTKYEIQQIQTKIILHEPQTTVTLLDSPITLTYTIEQGASTAYHSAPPLITQQVLGQVRYVGSRQNCSLDISKKTGTCIEEDQSPSLILNGDAPSTAIVTSSKTVTGPLLPLATVTIGSANGGSSTGGSGSGGSGGGTSTSDADPNSRVMAVQAGLLLGAIIAITVF
ncbi:hypothetical protein BJ912DRAFT_984998 [Pholiota molesta]|nr:hypothetical protein BJ912DRAFT_984998 [Pholiota molesta]